LYTCVNLSVVWMKLMIGIAFVAFPTNAVNSLSFGFFPTSIGHFRMHILGSRAGNAAVIRCGACMQGILHSLLLESV
jgi:hypothetical protein